MSTEFLKAIRLKDYSSVKSLIDKGIDLSFKDEFGGDALFYSVVYPHEDIFYLLLSKGINLNSIYKDNKKILHIAVESNLEEKGYFAFMQSLVKSGAEVNAKDKLENTPLWYACIYYVVNKNTIDLLLTNGADMFSVNKYGTNVFLSAKENKRKELLKILEKYITSQQH